MLNPSFAWKQPELFGQQMQTHSNYQRLSFLLYAGASPSHVPLAQRAGQGPSQRASIEADSVSPGGWLRFTHASCQQLGLSVRLVRIDAYLLTNSDVARDRTSFKASATTLEMSWPVRITVWHMMV